jgi:cysteine desulfurase/selenocysteine lyase
MTTPTPTSELTASPFDVAGLAQLANAFFASLPGQTPPVAAVQPAAPASVTPTALPATPDDAPAPPAELVTPLPPSPVNVQELLQRWTNMLESSPSGQ